MASVFVRDALASFTSDGTTDGYVTVASNADFYPSARVWIWDDNTAGREYIITDLVGSTKIGVRLVSLVPSYTRSNVSAYTTGQNAKISMDAQVVRVDQPTFSKTPKV